MPLQWQAHKFKSVLTTTHYHWKWKDGFSLDGQQQILKRSSTAILEEEVWAEDGEVTDE